MSIVWLSRPESWRDNVVIGQVLVNNVGNDKVDNDREHEPAEKIKAAKLFGVLVYQVNFVFFLFHRFYFLSPCKKLLQGSYTIISALNLHQRFLCSLKSKKNSLSAFSFKTGDF
jgi:hypothetical protein